MQYSLSFVEIWWCIVMSPEKCMIVGNKEVVARGGGCAHVRVCMCSVKAVG